MDITRENILVVDDDPLVLEALSQQLHALGASTVHLCESPLGALALLKRGEPVTTLLTDISMPGMDGPLFLRQVAEQQCRARIILISSVSNELMHSIGELGRSHGLNVIGYMHKPVTAKALLTLLAGKSSVATPTAAPAGTAQVDMSVGGLRQALARAEIHPWYQPKVDARGLHVSGVEALARWQLADGRIIGPGQFVPAMESCGLATELFLSVFAQVLKDLRRWQDRGVAIKAAVNLSMDCTQKHDLPEQIQTLLQDHEIKPDRIILEVTESRLMGDRTTAMETLTRLSLMGLRLSIDDFGTGYSSLAQLADLPFGELKIDGGFVRRAGTDAKADAILETTVTFGRSLGMEVVAEGVETYAQLDILRRLNALTLQGFLIARPMPGSEFLCWLDNWRPGTAHRHGCGRTFTMMIVDDSPSMRVVIEAELERRMPNIRVLQAGNALEALEMAKENMIDAATIDFYMPGQNGLELLGMLRDRCPAAHFVLLTSSMDDGIAREATRLGAMYCPKPLTDPQSDRIARYFQEN